MPHEAIEIREDRARFRLNHRNLRILAGECLDGVDAVPQRHREKFDLTLCFPCEQIGSTMPGSDASDGKTRCVAWSR